MMSLREGSKPDGRDATRLGSREPGAALAARARLRGEWLTRTLRFPRLHLSKDDARMLRNRRAAAQGCPAPTGWAFFTVFSEQRGKGVELSYLRIPALW
jgi:hypothetical protein